MLLRLLTFNVQGFMKVAKQIEVMQFARAARCDMLFLQETNFKCNREVEAFRERFAVECFFSFSQSQRAGGVGVVIFNRALLRNSYRTVDTKGRVICLDFYCGKKKYRVVNIYAPATPNLKNEFFSTLDGFLLTSFPTILVGDFNCFLDTNRDVRGPGQGRENSNARECQRIVQHFGLVDAWTLLHGETFQHTWQRGSSASRLDRVYVSRTLTGTVQICTALTFTGTPVHISDHRPVCVTLKFEDNGTSTSTTWRVDNRVLIDQGIREALGEQLSRNVNVVEPSAALWDGLKSQWRPLCEKGAKAWRQQQNVRMWDTVLRIRIVLRGAPLTSLMQEYLKELEHRYERLLRMSSAASTATWNRTGPQAHPEVLRMAEQILVRDRRPPVVGEDDPELFRRFSAHFASMACSEGKVADPNRLADVIGGLPRLSPGIANSIVYPPAEEEIHKSLMNMKPGTSPGPDGLTVEFYKTFWYVLREHLTVMVRNVVLGREVPASFKQGRIVLLPKEGDPKDPNSWRPITLLNTDYKLAARVMSMRIQTALSEVVSPWQLCSVPGRSIFSAASLTRDIVEFTKLRSARGLIVSLDQARAFDRIEHVYLFAVLEAFGFPEEVIGALRKLYNGMYSDLEVNGRVVSSFPVSRGVRQGCPLSPVLFVLSLDPLLVQVARDPNVRGLPIPGSSRVSVLAYADDVSLYLEDVDSVHRVLRLFETYGEVSGAQLNRSKSVALRLGGVEGVLPQVAWKPHVKILGITYNSEGVSRKTWNEIEKEIVQKTEVVKTYNLPLAQKRYVAHTVLCGRLWYASRVGTPPASFVTRVQHLLNSFFWSDKQVKVAAPASCLAREQGGWGFPCVGTFSKVLGIKIMLSIIDDENNIARGLALYFLGPCRREFVPRDRHNLSPSAEAPSSYYKRLLVCLKQIQALDSGLDVREAPATRVAEELVAKCMEPDKRGRMSGYPWKQMTAPRLPSHIQDFQWRKGWKVLPTKDKVRKWEKAVCPRCPNCDQIETNDHAFRDCVVARSFWKVLSCGFRELRISSYREQGKCPKEKFAQLLVATGDFVVWKNRGQALMCNRRQRAIWPILSRLRAAIRGHLEQELFVLGEELFLKRWSCMFVKVIGGRVALKFPALDMI